MVSHRHVTYQHFRKTVQSIKLTIAGIIRKHLPSSEDVLPSFDEKNWNVRSVVFDIVEVQYLTISIYVLLTISGCHQLNIVGIVSRMFNWCNGAYTYSLWLDIDFICKYFCLNYVETINLNLIGVKIENFYSQKYFWSVYRKFETF